MRDYEELVTALREDAEWAEGNIWEVPIMLPDHLKQAADAIEELTRENRSLADTVNKADEILRNRSGKWISVEDRLPKCEPGAEVGNIVFRLQSGTVYSGCFGRGGRQRDAYFRDWTDSGEGWDVEYVTHWMPLSELPEEET